MKAIIEDIAGTGGEEAADMVIVAAVMETFQHIRIFKMRRLQQYNEHLTYYQRIWCLATIM
jgi:hypothetical protein